MMIEILLHRVGRKRLVERLAVAAAGDARNAPECFPPSGSHLLRTAGFASSGIRGTLRSPLRLTWRLGASLRAARVTPYRHPYEALTFWGLEAQATVVGSGSGRARDGVDRDSRALRPRKREVHTLRPCLIMGGAVRRRGGKSRRRARRLLKGVADKSVFGEVKAYDFGPQHPDSSPAGSVDLVLVARAFHNWARQGDATQTYLHAFFTMLKPGGSSRRRTAPCAWRVRTRAPEPVMSSESYVIEEARKAGSSSRQSPRSTPTQKTPKTILSAFGRRPRLVAARRLGSPLTRTLTTQNTMRLGQSDRMTFRFRKPGLRLSCSSDEAGVPPEPDSAFLRNLHHRGVFSAADGQSRALPEATAASAWARPSPFHL